MASQTLKKSQRFEITLTFERGIVFSIGISPTNGPTSFSGRLLSELGNGERVVIDDPLGLFREIFDLGFELGRAGGAGQVEP